MQPQKKKKKYFIKSFSKLNHKIYKKKNTIHCEYEIGEQVKLITVLNQNDL